MAHKLLQDEKGILYIAKEVEVVAVEEAQKLLSHLQSDLTLVQGFLAKAANGQTDGSSQDTPTDTTAQSSDQSQTVAAPAAPADPNQPPAEDPNAQPAPVDQTVPAADQNAAQAPALDANGNPVQVPAQDPNQVQPQPEQSVLPPLQ